MMLPIALRRRSFQSLAAAVVLVFLGLVSILAQVSGVALILFPELAALSYDVITRPQGRWAARPMQVILTPTLTAILGLFLTQHLRYGALSMFLVVGLSLVTIKVTKSTVAPAISAGLLPMVLGEERWLYPVAICLGTGMLVGALRLWQVLVVSNDDQDPAAEHSAVVEALEAAPHARYWYIALMLFVLLLGAAAQISEMRFLLFPPLVVMAYELFGHPEVPGWMKRPAFFPLVCLITASIGLLAHRWIHPGYVAVVVTVLCSVLVLRAFTLHMPPALAVGLLPFVMTAPDYRFLISVLFGTIALTLYHFAYARALPRMLTAAAPGMG